MDKKLIWQKYIEIVEQTAAPPSEDEITTREFAAMFGITLWQARRILEEGYRRGELMRRYAYLPSSRRRILVYKSKNVTEIN